MQVFFSEIDSDLSSFYEEHPNTAEPQLDGSFIRSLTSKSFDLHASRINAVRRRNRLRPIYLQIKATPITATERTYGADIGLVARVNIPGEHEITEEQLRYNWVRNVQRVRTVRSPRIAFSLRKSKILSKNSKNTVLR